MQYKLGVFAYNRKFKAKGFMVPEKHGRLKIVTEGFIKAIHKKNLYLHVWTVNDEAAMKRLFKIGVDGIFTDDPRLLIQTLK